MAKLSDTALTILNGAAQRDDRIAELPVKLPAAAHNAVARSLLKQGLLGQVDGGTLHITDAGFRALNLESPKDENTATAPHSGLQESMEAGAGTSTPGSGTVPCGPQNAAVSLPRPKLRDASQMVLDAWLARDAEPENLATAIGLLERAIAAKPGRTGATVSQRRPREGTKQQAVLNLLRRPEGTNIAQIVSATAWAQHTVRGFLANLKRKGITVGVLERVRQVGPGSTGAKGSYSIYRIASAG